MTLLPEPRQAILFPLGRRASAHHDQEERLIAEKWADRDHAPARDTLGLEAWEPIGQLADGPVITPEVLEAAVEGINAFAEALSSIATATATVILSFDWDGMAAVLLAGTKNRKDRLTRKRARIRLRKRRRAERVAAMPSQKGRRS